MPPRNGSRLPVSIALQNSDGLLEVTDNMGLVICVLPKKDVLAQNLTHKSVFLNLRGSSGAWILRWREETGFCFAARGEPPAGMSCDDFCASLLSRYASPFPLKPRLYGIHPPAPQNGNSFSHMYEARVDERFLSANADMTPVTHGDLCALLERGYPFCPFLRLAFDSGWLKI